MTNRLHHFLAALLYLFFVLFLIWPLWQAIASGFTRSDNGHFTFAYFSLVFHDPVLVRGLINALAVAAAVTLLVLLLCLPLAFLTIRYEFPGRALLTGLLLVPLILPPFVGAIGLRLVLSRFGPLSILLGASQTGIDWLGHYRLLGIIIVETLHLYPVMLLNLQASLANLDPAMEQAAANLGANRWTILRRVTLPLLRPGLFAGCTLTLIWSFTELGTPLVFDFYTITPVQLFERVTDIASNPEPFALVVVTLLTAGGLYALGKVALGQSPGAATTKASVASSSRTLHGFAAFAATAALSFVFLLAALPHISVILTSLTQTGGWYRTLFPHELTLAHFRAALTDELALPSVFNSICYAALATVIALIVGVTAAVVIVRGNLRTAPILDHLTMLPLAVPGIVLSFGYLAISVHLRRIWGDQTPLWLNVQEYPVLFLVIAYSARRLPYVVRSAVAGLQQTPRDLELAAANLGATRLRVLGKITLPLISANLIAGALLAFAFAMLEVSDSLILAQKQEYFPITRALVELSQRLGDGIYIASALGVWAMVLLALTILTANALLGKRLGAAFRV
ncbi:MAG TPA: ABC transporter permease subunit [Tepidisphaeraceae bacterium]|nr:ABC transporter permease subunit [Tepidisphaeraceae bacterium]